MTGVGCLGKVKKLICWLSVLGGGGGGGLYDLLRVGLTVWFFWKMVESIADCCQLKNKRRLYYSIGSDQIAPCVLYLCIYVMENYLASFRLLLTVDTFVVDSDL